MKTKGMGVALLSTAALLAGGAANAGELPWNYVEFGYSQADGNDFFEVDAYDLKASIAFATKWHAQLSYTDGEGDSDFFSDGVDFDGYRLVIGAHPQLTPNTQLVIDGTYFDYEVDEDGGEGSKGYGVGFGLRHSLTDKVELMAQAWYVDGEFEEGSFEYDYSDTVVELGGRYNWTSNLSAGLMIGLDGTVGSGELFGSSDDVVRFDLRWSFGAGDVSDSL